MEFIGDKTVNFNITGTPPLDLKTNSEKQLLERARQKRLRKNTKRLKDRK